MARPGAEIRTFFDRSTRDPRSESGLETVSFGEFLVDRRVINRHQLFCALQMQDRNPGVRLGECLAALGFLPYAEVERYLSSWKGID